MLQCIPYGSCPELSGKSQSHLLLSCVVSTFRLRKNVSREKLTERLVKVVNHELGHTFGFPHCPTSRCLMQDAKGTIKTVDNETGRFCPACRERWDRLRPPAE